MDGSTFTRAGCHPQSFRPDLLLQARSSDPALPLPVCSALSHPILASFLGKTLPLSWSTSEAGCGPHIPSSSPPFSLVHPTRHDTLAGSRFPPWVPSSAQSVPPYVVSCHCPGSHLCPWGASSNAAFSIWKFLHGCFRNKHLMLCQGYCCPPPPSPGVPNFISFCLPSKLFIEAQEKFPSARRSVSAVFFPFLSLLCSGHTSRICLGTLWSHPAPDSLTLCPSAAAMPLTRLYWVFVLYSGNGLD